ncbi:MAG: DUF2220 domain-containing protein [Treponema sp.]|jgi:hypothetical protein|nr:DUF2220 domain-containing protein [Treponema sp.]
MTGWEKKILNAFISHYFASVREPAAEARQYPPGTEEDHRTLRIRSSVFFPDFDTAHPNEKESYLEAAESLERKGIIQLRWEKRDKGERLKTITCENFEKLFDEAGRPFPQTEAEKTRAMLGEKIAAFKETRSSEKIIALLEFFSINFGPQEIGHGIDQQTMEDFISLLEFLSEPARLEKITTRALSILLYHDSKRLEDLLSLCMPLLYRAQKTIPVPDIAVLERSYPETMISGKLIFEYKSHSQPLVNAEGLVLGLPLESAEAIKSIQSMPEKKEKAVLTIENKETFYALGSPQKYSTSESLSRYDCFLYIGGYPNRAAGALIKTLASSGFSFYHAGDMDPDGVLILQQVQDIAGRAITPVRMDGAAFDKYRTWARPLTKPMLRQVEKIREETRTIPGLADLLRRIEETGLGVEQEIVDYR